MTAPFVYMNSDVPPGQTLAAWRHGRAHSSLSRRRRLVLLLGRLPFRSR